MDGPSFVVERFGWGAPDRLEVAGIFSGVGAGSAGDAVLTVVGDDGAHRLPAIDNGDAEPPAEGAHWEAEFAWLEAPVAFERARLELGTSLAVELPAPGEAADGDALAVELLDAPVELLDAPVERLDLETQLLEQFREGLAQVRSSAEDALQAAQIELAEARRELAAVRGELDDVRSELDDARDLLAAARTDAKALVDRLSGRR